MDSKSPVAAAAKPLRRKVHVVYYLSRGGGQMDHPHLLEGYLSAAQDGLRLRDFKRWLSVLRGKSMPSTYAWSYKRTYKNGFIWHDLGENDMIQPLTKNEYVLMGSEIKEHGVLGKCKCGGLLQQQADQSKVGAELGHVQEEPLNRSVPRSPKPVTKSSLANVDDDEANHDAVSHIRNNHSGRLVASETAAYDTKMISKGGVHYRGGSSRSVGEINALRLVEEVKRPTSYHEANKHPANRSFSHSQRIGISTARATTRDADLGEDQEDIVEATSNGEVQGEPYESRREARKVSCSSSPYLKHTALTPNSRRDYTEDGNQDNLVGVATDRHGNDDDDNGAYIMNAATQTGDSTRCSTDHQDGAVFTAQYSNMMELMESPNASAKYSGSLVYSTTPGADTVRSMVSSARPNYKNQQGGSGVVIRGSVSKQLSREFANLPDVEKAMMQMSQTSEMGAEDSKVGNVASSNSTSLLNHMGSPALSSCSTMSARSTRFARDDHQRIPSSAAAAKIASKKAITRGGNSHQAQHQKGPSGTTMASSTNTLLKQLLTCGNADVVRESKPVGPHVLMSSNALSGLQTPSRMMSARSYQEGLIHGPDMRKGSNGNSSSTVWACKPGLMKRLSTASSDNKSVISATVSDQASVRDTQEIMSSPESVYSHRHLKSHIIKAQSISASQLQASGADATATGSASPGVLSVGSSTSRRSSIRDNDTSRMVGGGNVEEHLKDGLRSHHVGLGVSPKTRPNKGNKHTIMIHEILDNEIDQANGSPLDENGTTMGKKASPASVKELHKLICNPSGTPICTNNHNKVLSSRFTTTLPFERHAHHSTRESFTPQHHQPRHKLAATHGHTRTPNRSSNINSPSLLDLSKSLNSPYNSMFLEEISQPPPSSSNYVTSWKDLLWSPRYNSHKEKEKRHMKP